MKADQETVSRRTRIVILLENYNDVEAGLRDRGSDGEHLPLMCRPWRVPRQGYPELDHQLGVMKDLAPTLYWHLANIYFTATSRRVLECPRCRSVVPTWSTVNFHKHGHTNVAVVPRVIRVPQSPVSTRSVDDAIDWLSANWRGEVFLPDELLPKVA